MFCIILVCLLETRYRGRGTSIVFPANFSLTFTMQASLELFVTLEAKHYVGFAPKTILLRSSCSCSLAGGIAANRSSGRIMWQLPQLPPPPQTAIELDINKAGTCNIYGFILANLQNCSSLVSFHLNRVFIGYRVDSKLD